MFIFTSSIWIDGQVQLYSYKEGKNLLRLTLFSSFQQLILLRTVIFRQGHTIKMLQRWKEGGEGGEEVTIQK